MAVELARRLALLAAFCVAKNRAPREVRAKTGLYKEFQEQLTDQGVQLRWRG